jgi:DNA-binding MarR family transcriptional regulator
MNPQPDIETTAKDAWHKLFLISDILRNTSYQAADQEFHFNFAQFPVIQFFFECPDAAPAMKDLIAVSGLSSGALSQAVDSLVLSGYVERVRSKTDLRSYLVHATAKLKALRAKSVGGFDDALRAFRLSAGLTPEEISAADEILLRLAESRTGGELTVLKEASGLETPGLISCGKRDLTQTPVWMLLLHFTTNLRMPVLMYHSGERKRTTLNKLRFMNYLFFLSAHKNRLLSGRSFHTAPKTIRGRVMAYLNSVSLQQRSHEFDIPFDRQQLADYLNLERTALSKELSRMRKDGILECRKNHFKLL